MITQIMDIFLKEARTALENNGSCVVNVRIHPDRIANEAKEVFIYGGQLHWLIMLLELPDWNEHAYCERLDMAITHVAYIQQGLRDLSVRSPQADTRLFRMTIRHAE